MLYLRDRTKVVLRGQLVAGMGRMLCRMLLPSVAQLETRLRSIWMVSPVWTAQANAPSCASGKLIGFSAARPFSRARSAKVWEFRSRGVDDDHPFPRAGQASGGKRTRRKSCRGSVADHRSRAAPDLHGGAGRQREDGKRYKFVQHDAEHRRGSGHFLGGNHDDSHGAAAHQLPYRQYHPSPLWR